MATALRGSPSWNQSEEGSETVSSIFQMYFLYKSFKSITTKCRHDFMKACHYLLWLFLSLPKFLISQGETEIFPFVSKAEQELCSRE